MNQPAALKQYRRVYLATPYSKFHLGLQEAWKGAVELTAKLLHAGISAYSPIAYTHPIALMGNFDPLDHNIWLPFDHSQMEDADALVVATMQGWDDSYGVGVEIEFFRKAGKPVYLLHPVTLEVIVFSGIANGEMQKRVPALKTPLELAIDRATDLSPCDVEAA